MASEYMALSGIDAAGKKSQLLAMIMLQNCKLDENTWNSITIQFVGNADRRMQVEKAISTPISVAPNSLNDIKRQVADLQSSLNKNLRVLTGDADAVVHGSSGDVAEMNVAAQSIASALMFCSPESYTSSKNPEIFLDDPPQIPLRKLRSSLTSLASKI